ncbi:hypothetical protein HK096_009321 [Nowakowskiella sp. JEL0078]|nr:hypothetical protein HK096_009321 [Nowakowskiella sp. JEL0078]
MAPATNISSGNSEGPAITHLGPQIEAYFLKQLEAQNSISETIGYPQTFFTLSPPPKYVPTRVDSLPCPKQVEKIITSNSLTLAVAICDFSPKKITEKQIGDEIELNAGDEVRMMARFDDGWVYGRNLRDGKFGTFPLDVLRISQ